MYRRAIDHSTATLTAIATSFANGGTSRALVDACLARINDPQGEGRRTFLKVHEDSARITANDCDAQRRKGGKVPIFAGIPVSVKDLFDMTGDVTTAGSVALKDAAPASQDAHVVANLRSAGLIPIGRTNMTEFAFSGLGLNPHYGTPRNPFDRARGRIPGGSSSGAAISVTDGMAFAALGTDTGGSCRIPAALCGVVGFKPTARRIRSTGLFPLSSTLDSIGSIANSVACCAIIDSIITGQEPTPPRPHPLAGLHFAIPQTLVLDDLDPEVTRNFERAVGLLSQAKVKITWLPLPELAEIARINVKGGPVSAEAYATHQALIAAKRDLYDPRVLSRIMFGAEQTAADYILALRARAALIERVNLITAPYDALLMPTVPTVAPTIDELAQDDVYRTKNMLMLRNPSIANFLDLCSVSLPCHHSGDLPTGLMLMGHHCKDAQLLAIACGVEALLKKQPG